MFAMASVAALIGVSAIGLVFIQGTSKLTKQTAETSAPRETSSVAKQTQSVASTAGSEPHEEKAAPVNSQATEPAAEPSLPEFAGEPLETKSPPAVVSDSIVDASAESSEVVEAATTIDTSVVREVSESAPRGGLLRELWTNVTGNKVEEFVQYVAEHPEPNQTGTIDRFEPPEDLGDQYGQRLRGYLHPPTTGNYEFSIRANAAGWLYVSSDALPENKQRVEPGAKIAFEGGKVYYVEAFHKESTGRDYLSVGWKLPDASEEKPIPGERLSVQYRIAPRHETEFVVLTPEPAESLSDTKYEVLDDGKILATGPATDGETYRLKFKSEMETITALRLEAIPHDSLPASGPGRGIGGRFALAELSATVIDNAAPNTSRAFTFASAVDDSGNDLRRIVDGDEKTLWRASGRGKQAVVTLVTLSPTMVASGSVLQIEIVQRESVGCLRVLATSAPDPRALNQTLEGKSHENALFSLFVNLGGDDFTAPDGVRWRASKLFDNETFGHEGGRSVSEDLITNKVQGSAQRGIAAFRAMVPEGTYDVTLYFCEYWSTTPSSRKFAIAAEQRVVAPQFDLFQAAGGFAKPFAYLIRKVAVSDGRLDLQFGDTPDGASTILNAISIQQVR